MKKVFSLLLFLAMQTVLFAQEHEYIPFVEEGKVWYCGYNHPGVTFHATAEDPSAKGIDCIFTMQGDASLRNTMATRISTIIVLLGKKTTVFISSKRMLQRSSRFMISLIGERLSFSHIMISSMAVMVVNVV